MGRCKSHTSNLTGFGAGRQGSRCDGNLRCVNVDAGPGAIYGAGHGMSR